MDFVDRLLDAIEKDLNLFTYIVKGSLVDGNSISASEYPTSPNTNYYDKSKIQTIGLQIRVKNKDKLIAETTIHAINDYLDGKTNVFSQNDSFQLIVIETYTAPNFVETNDRNEHIYTALFQADLYREVITNGI
jgi:Bacteriophage minor capsid protein